MIDTEGRNCYCLENIYTDGYKIIRPVRLKSFRIGSGEYDKGNTMRRAYIASSSFFHLKTHFLPNSSLAYSIQ